jgi:putative ABC transport system permease protein
VISAGAARKLGYQRPEDAINKAVKADLGYAAKGVTPCTIIGVVDDALFRSVRDPQQPILYVKRSDAINVLLVRFSQGRTGSVQDGILLAWRELFPSTPFHSDLVEALVRAEYKTEFARAKLLAFTGLLCSIIASLGIVGLVYFTAETRMKEIAIRKVFGARTRDIVVLLAMQFGRNMLISNCIAWPLAWMILNDWLDSFNVAVKLGFLPFAAAGGTVALLGALTAIGHTWRVARASPVWALRNL